MEMNEISFCKILQIYILSLSLSLSLERWMCVNKLNMTAEKTKCMIVRRERREQKGDIILKRFDGTLIKRMQRIKYSSIIIDDTLRLGDYCDNMLKKIDKK